MKESSERADGGRVGRGEWVLLIVYQQNVEVEKFYSGVSVKPRKMNYLQTQNSFNNARIITTHSDRPIGVAISIPFMGLKRSESSRILVSQHSVNPLKGLKASGSFVPHAITSSVIVCIVIDPFSVIVVLLVSK